MRQILVAILMLIVVGFSYIGFTNMDTGVDANPSIPKETKQY
ncbi:hypothetical protein [Halobacillus litoralis]|nr:hypothetical protein [Halobacillus litoralis]